MRALTVCPFAVAVLLPAVAGAEDHLFVATSEGHLAGNCASLELVAPWTAATGLEAIGVAPVPRYFGGLHYVVCGAPENDLRIIDPTSFETIRTIPFDSESNPRDVVVVGDGTAFVSFYDRAHLLRVDLTTGATVAAIDLGLYSDTDGLPEMDRMTRDGDHLFVQLQRIDRSPAPPPPMKGALAVVGIEASELIDADPNESGTQAIELSWYTPRLPMQIEGRRLFVSEPGGFYDQMGGIEAIDLDTLEPKGLVFHEKEMGVAQMSGFVFVSATRGYVINHTDFTQSSHVVSFSRTTGTFLAEHFVTFGLTETYAFDPVGGLLYFPDSDANNAGIRVFDAATGTQWTATPISTGLAPVECVVARAGGTPAPDPALPVSFSIVPAPNPARGSARLLLDAARAGRFDLSLMDVRGRVVRRWPGGIDAPRGRSMIAWDGRDDEGHLVPPGVYAVRLDGGGPSTASARLVVVR